MKGYFIMLCQNCNEQVKNTMKNCPFCGSELPKDARSERTVEINVAPIADIVKDEDEESEELDESDLGLYAIDSDEENTDDEGVLGNSDTLDFGANDNIGQMPSLEDSPDYLPMIKRRKISLEPAKPSEYEKEDIEYRKKRGMYSSELEMTNFALDERNMMAEEEANLLEEKRIDLIQVFHNKEYHFDVDEENVSEEIKIKEEIPVESEQISDFEEEENEETVDEMGQELLEEKKKDLVQVFHNKEYHFDIDGKEVTYIDAEFVEEDDEDDDDIEEGIPNRGLFSFIKRLLSRK